ncbi:Os12g0112500 [Oryza sativa Japonica Group]|uniref:Os12g0112500 protein n=1 Tax=Oryza sativa subsp. japonica TaxID=39947 RepID=Q0IQM2_ORYSJ|nr:Os12g0112500 [Oryza sativa Japonica Group]|eukprot:NP_001065974.2 Os12g0112500 [Oryza sativa Japonica Group]
MQFSLCYSWNVGMNYAIISDSLIVGSQPQKPEDIDHLKDEEKVAFILCLQQDKDIEYWGIDFQTVVNRCKELGIKHIRRPVRRLFMY